MYKVIANYSIVPGLSLFLIRGSVVHFQGKTDKAAIVNAANQGCLGGGGVDGAISAAGGEHLAADRIHLPVLEKRGPYEIRCRIGEAVITGPGDYNELGVPYLIHAVGPNYNVFDEENYDIAHKLLQSAYRNTLIQASERSIEQVAFSLLSAGVFRGRCSLEQVLDLGIQAIQQWALRKPVESPLREIHVFAFTPAECKILKKICSKLFGVEDSREISLSILKSEDGDASVENVSMVEHFDEEDVLVKIGAHDAKPTAVLPPRNKVVEQDNPYKEKTEIPSADQNQLKSTSLSEMYVSERVEEEAQNESDMCLNVVATIDETCKRSSPPIMAKGLGTGKTKRPAEG